VNKPSLPEGLIYEPAREVVDKALRQEGFTDSGMPVDKWAKLIVQDLLKKKPPPVI
jgi:1-acylglycerone phosphate reductase